MGPIYKFLGLFAEFIWHTLGHSRPKYIAKSLKHKIKESLPSENEVKMHCVNTNGREYMCKTCGRTFDALATARHYCDNCGCWICPSCATKNNSFWDYPNILAEPEEKGGILYCHCQLPVNEKVQVANYGRGDFRCCYCGARWYK